MRMIHDVEIKKLIRLAQEAKGRAYCPYSTYAVGACLKAGSGAYYEGCNIENAAFSPSICAERVALFRAVYQGERKFDALAVVVNTDEFATPCGVCRQTLAEFCDADMPVICANKSGKYRVISLGELLPYAFTSKDME